jgi:hypothetical protein
VKGKTAELHGMLFITNHSMADVREELLYIKPAFIKKFECIYHLQFKLPYFREDASSAKLQFLSRPHNV